MVKRWIDYGRLDQKTLEGIEVVAAADYDKLEAAIRHECEMGCEGEFDGICTQSELPRKDWCAQCRLSLVLETPVAHSKSQQRRFEAQGVDHVPFASEARIVNETADAIARERGLTQETACDCGHDGPIGPGHQSNCPRYAQNRETK